MKRICYLLLFVIFFTGCEKDNFTGPTELLGKWDWMVSWGGFNYTEPFYPTADWQVQIEFTSSYKYIETINDEESKEKTFTITNSYERDGIKYLEISFLDGGNASISINQATLVMRKGDLFGEYTRVE